MDVVVDFDEYYVGQGHHGMSLTLTHHSFSLLSGDNCPNAETLHALWIV